MAALGSWMHAIRETDDWVDSSGHALGELADGDVIGVDDAALWKVSILRFRGYVKIAL